MSESKKHTPKTVELVSRDYQPTKAEKEEEFKVEATLEQLTDAVLKPVKIRWTDKPRNRKR